MIVRRILSGSVVTLLLAVSSMAGACDLSCAFALADSDCHSAEIISTSSTDREMAMDGMDMAGMEMPGMAGGAMQTPATEVSPAVAAHPSIGDMGPCERQSCDKGSFVSVKASRAGGLSQHSLTALARIPATNSSGALHASARDDVASHRFDPPTPPSPSLRI